MRDTFERAIEPAMSCERLADNAFVFRFRAMASPCEVCIEGVAPTMATVAAEKVVAEVARIERKYSRYRADSVISRINALAGIASLSVDDETLALFRFAESLYRESEGLFDITSGILRRVWDFKAARLPTNAALDELRQRVDAASVRIEGYEVGLLRPGMEIDFGGFGKEYAADRAAALLELDGIAHGLVNLGGDLRVIGAKADGSPWSIGIAHPRRATETIASIALASGALATSGDYERFFELDGRRYCHILNPETGWPVSHWQSVSVLAPLCIAAGALATVAMLKEADAIEFLDQQHCAYLAIRSDGARFSRSLPDAPSPEH